MKANPIFRLLGVAGLVALMLQLAGVRPAAAALTFDPAQVVLEPVAAGFSSPVGIANAGDGSGRLFVVEQAGRIRVVGGGSPLTRTFLDIHTLVNSGGERGLLSLAFHPNYASNHKFYVMYTNFPDGSLALWQYTQSGPDPDSAGSVPPLLILAIPHPSFGNHNGGTLLFGPDGYLYWTTGDGGLNGDRAGGSRPAGNAQNLNTLLGKVLRLDLDNQDPGLNYSVPATNPFVGVPSTRGEIWAYGLRNPWRASFDRITGDMFIGDVGEARIEEIDFAPAGLGGRNYGWNVKEGTECFNVFDFNLPLSSCIPPAAYVDPITQYSHSVGDAIAGGYRYHGAQFPALEGRYFYGDEITGALFALFENPPGVWTRSTIPVAAHNISTFGEDEQGELYLADYGTGTIYQIVFSPQTPRILHVYPPDASTACLSPQVGADLQLTDLLRSAGAFNPSTIMLKVDGIDVTGSSVSLQSMGFPASLGSISYTPPIPLAVGPHSAELDYPAFPTGTVTSQWSFTLAAIPCIGAGGAHAPLLEAGPASPSTETPPAGLRRAEIP